MLRYLVDTSAIARFGDPRVSDILSTRIALGFVGMCIATELEWGYSARSAHDYGLQRGFIEAAVPVLVTPRSERRAVEIQGKLVDAGTHRAVSVVDLMVAAVADVERLTILHYDADFDLIASVTGQATEWVVPRGSTD